MCQVDRPIGKRQGFGWGWKMIDGNSVDIFLTERVTAKRSVMSYATFESRQLAAVDIIGQDKKLSSSL